MAVPQRDDPPTPASFAEATEDKWLRRPGTIEAIKRLEPPSRMRFRLRRGYGGQDGGHVR